LAAAFYCAWLDEHQLVVNLTGRLDGEIARQRQQSEDDRKRELIRIITVLHELQEKVLSWRDVAKDKWGMPPATVSLLPADWSTVIYQAGTISPELRTKVEGVGTSLAKANSLITEFLSMQVNYRDAGLMSKAYELLNGAAPEVSNVIAEFEAFEKSLG